MQTMKFIGAVLGTLTVSVGALWAFEAEGPAGASRNAVAFQHQPSSLDDAVAGRDAVVRLGTQISAVARQNGLGAPELREMLLDPAVRVDRSNRIAFVEEAPTVEPTDEPAIEWNGGNAFELHSRPGADRVIYLDVDGHTTSGTAWNSSGDIVSAPFDLDGDPSNWSSAEHDRLAAYWMQVAEDFAPWDVDVTTQEPSAERLRKSSSSDGQYGVRVVVSPTNWYSTGAGGVAYLNSYSYSNDTPVFVFTQQLGNGNAKYVSDTISHEVGHALGLRHDGHGSAAYYYGHNDWAPIMGAGFYSALTQWSAGEYAEATNTEDDLAKIGGILPLRTDDVGDTPATATELAEWAIANGLIADRDDVDVFAVESPSGDLRATLTPAVSAPNLDAQLSVLDANGQTYFVSDPAGTAGPSVDLQLAPGRYYLVVDGVGARTPTDGYSDYASIGRYRLEVDARGDATTTTTTLPTTTTTVAPTTTTPPTTTQPPTTTTPPTTTAPPTTTTPPTTTQPDVAPVARIDTTSLSVAPGDAITFDASGSYDADGGSITKYQWHFDGQKPPKGTDAVETRTWTSSGTYTVRLTVTDDEGVTATNQVNVVVTTSGGGGDGGGGDEPVGTLVEIASLEVVRGPGGGAVAVVTLLDETGVPVADATVSGSWSGAAKGAASAITDVDGTARTAESRLRGKSTTATITIDRVTVPAGYTWDGEAVTASAAL